VRRAAALRSVAGGDLDETEEEESPGGPDWAESQVGLGRRENFPRKMVRATNRVWAEMETGLQSSFFFFF